MFKGICHIIRRTTKRLAGYKKIIFSFQKYQTANSQHLFPVQMRRSGSWREWGTYQIRIAIAYRIVSSWIYSILSAPTNSCESCFCKPVCTFFYILLRRSKGKTCRKFRINFFQALRLPQSQPEPPLHIWDRNPAKVLVPRGQNAPKKSEKLCSIAGGRDLLQYPGPQSFLHLLAEQPDEEEAQGQFDHHQVKGESGKRLNSRAYLWLLKLFLLFPSNTVPHY